MLTALIPPSTQDRIKRFVDVFAKRCTDIAVVVPNVMRAGPTDQEGWTPWKPVDSPIGNVEVLALESEFGAKFPPLFRAYLMYKCLLMTDFAVILPETPFDNPLGKMRSYLDLWNSEPFLRNHRLVPFAFDANDAGPVCFDIKSPRMNGDYQIVLVDHGRMRDRSYEGEVIAGSFSELLDNIERELLSYD